MVTIKRGMRKVCLIVLTDYNPGKRGRYMRALLGGALTGNPCAGRSVSDLEAISSVVAKLAEGGVVL
jgi:hypothetical protein